MKVTTNCKRIQPSNTKLYLELLAADISMDVKNKLKGITEHLPIHPFNEENIKMSEGLLNTFLFSRAMLADTYKTIGAIKAVNSELSDDQIDKMLNIYRTYMFTAAIYEYSLYNANDIIKAIKENSHT